MFKWKNPCSCYYAVISLTIKNNVESIPKSRFDPNTRTCRAVPWYHGCGIVLTHHQWKKRQNNTGFFPWSSHGWVFEILDIWAGLKYSAHLCFFFHPLLCRCPEEECGEEFHSKLGLTRHMLGHKKRDNLALTCPVKGCGKTFKWKSRYDVHLRSHNGGSMVAFCVATMTD